MINWKVRFKNKTFLLTFLIALISCIYNILGVFSIVPSVSESSLAEITTSIVNLLVLLGIVIDPTTNGISDSERVLNNK